MNIVIRVEFGKWWLWAAPLVVLILMLVWSNVEIKKQRTVNAFGIMYAQQEIERLHHETQKCKRLHRMAIYRHDELLGLWAGKEELETLYAEEEE